MKHIVLYAVFLSLSICAMDSPRKVTIKNFSELAVTVYYHPPQQYIDHVVLQPLDSTDLSLVRIPQQIIVSFNKLNKQGKSFTLTTDAPIIIQQKSLINIAQNEQSLVSIEYPNSTGSK